MLENLDWIVDISSYLKIFFVNFGRGIYYCKSILLKLQLQFTKRLRNSFYCNVLNLHKLKRCVLAFWISNWGHYIFVCGLISVLHFQIKSSFSSKKNHPRWNLWHAFIKKLSNFNVKNIKGKFCSPGTWSSAKFCRIAKQH